MNRIGRWVLTSACLNLRRATGFAINIGRGFMSSSEQMVGSALINGTVLTSAITNLMNDSGLNFHNALLLLKMGFKAGHMTDAC